MGQAQSIAFFEADPELLQCVPAVQRPVAERARVQSLRWSPGSLRTAELERYAWGLLVISGVMAREVTVAGVGAAELVGPGDVLLMSAAESGEPMASHARWTVLEELHVVVLDEHVQTLIARWPGLAVGLLRRSEMRASRLAVAQAIGHATRIDARVVAIMWTLAARWGRVTPDGIVLPLRLTHRTIARLIGARRPSVTTAITHLGAEGRLRRRADGSWLLTGAPPPELGSATFDQVLAAPAPGRTTTAH